MNSDIQIKEIEVSFEPFVARTPLKFGAVVIEHIHFCRVKTTVENDRGEVADGWGGIFIADNWAWPTPELGHEDKEAAMMEVARLYADMAATYPVAAHPIDIFCDLEDDLRTMNEEVCAKRGLVPAQPFLGGLVCASPVDAALHDAFGNVNGIDSYDGYGPDFMSDLSKYLGADFKGKYVEDYIRSQYLPQIPIFHLVGGLDKLTQAEKDESDPDDGKPVSLDEWIRAEGMYCLKVKLRGNDLDWDVERVLAVHRIGRQELPNLDITELHLTVDTNEQCESPDYIIEMLHKIKEQSEDCYERILYIEQPTERDMTAHRYDMTELSQLKPVIVDESLTDLESFELAIELGWSGVALKTCKGHSADMLFAAKAQELGIPYALQDLTNPSLSLIHSVGMGARLYTIMGVEANSRQFFPDATTEAEQHVHGGIFNVRRGQAETSSLQGTGLGYQMDKLLN